MANFAAVLPDDEISQPPANVGVPGSSAPMPAVQAPPPLVLQRGRPLPPAAPIQRPAPRAPVPYRTGQVIPREEPGMDAFRGQVDQLAAQRKQDTFERQTMSYENAALREQVRQQKAAMKARKDAEKQALDESNAIAEASAQGAGIATHKDEYGRVQESFDPMTGRTELKQLTTGKQWDQSGNEYSVTRLPTGEMVMERKDKLAKIGPDENNPQDPNIYRHNTESPWQGYDPKVGVFSSDPEVVKASQNHLHTSRKKDLMEKIDIEEKLKPSNDEILPLAKRLKLVEDEAAGRQYVSDVFPETIAKTKEYMAREKNLHAMRLELSQIKDLTPDQYGEELRKKATPEERMAIQSKELQDKLAYHSEVEKELAGVQQKLENDRKALIARRSQPMNRERDLPAFERDKRSWMVRKQIWETRRGEFQKELEGTQKKAAAMVPQVDTKDKPVDDATVNDLAKDPESLAGASVAFNGNVQQFIDDKKAFETEAEARKAKISTTSDGIAFDNWYAQKRAMIQSRAVDIDNRAKTVDKAQERSAVLKEDDLVANLTKSPFHADIAPQVRDIQQALRRDSVGLPEGERQKLADVAAKNVAAAIDKGNQRQKEIFNLIDAHGHSRNMASRVQPEPDDEPWQLQMKQKAVDNEEAIRKRKLKPAAEMTPAETEAEALRASKPENTSEAILPSDVNKWAKLTGMPKETVEKTVDDYQKSSFSGIYADAVSHKLSDGTYVVNPVAMWDSEKTASESNSKEKDDKQAFDMSLYKARKDPANQAWVMRTMEKSFPDAWPNYAKEHSDVPMAENITNFRKKEGLDGNKFARLLNPLAWGSFAGTREKLWQAVQTAGSGVVASLGGLANLAANSGQFGYVPEAGKKAVADAANFMHKGYEGEAGELAGMNSAAADLTKMTVEMIPFMKVGALIGMGARAMGVGEGVLAAKALPQMGRVVGMGKAAASAGATTAKEYAAAMVEAGMQPNMASIAGKHFATLMETGNSAPLMKSIMAGMEAPILHKVASFSTMAAMTTGGVMNAATKAYTEQGVQQMLEGRDITKISPEELDSIKQRAETYGVANGLGVAALSGVLAGMVAVAFPKGMESITKRMMGLPKEAVNMTAADFLAASGGEKTLLDVIHSGSMKEGVKSLLKVWGTTGKIMSSHVLDQAAEMFLFTVSQELVAKATYNPRITLGEIVHSAVESSAMGAFMGVLPGMTETFGKGRALDKARKAGDSGKGGPGDAKGGVEPPDEPIAPQSPEEVKAAVDELDKFHAGVSSDALIAAHEGHGGEIPDLAGIDTEIAAKRKAVDMAPEGEAKDAAMVELHDALVARSDALNQMAGVVTGGDPAAAKAEIEGERTKEGGNPANADMAAAALAMQEHGWDGITEQQRSILTEKRENGQPAVLEDGGTHIFEQSFLNNTAKAFPETSKMLPVSELAQRAVHGKETTAKPATEAPKPKAEEVKPAAPPVEHPEDVKAAIHQIEATHGPLEEADQAQVAEALGHVRESMARFQPAFGDKSPVFTMKSLETAGFEVIDGRLHVSIPDVLKAVGGLKKGVSVKQWGDLILREEGIHQIVDGFSKTPEGKRVFDEITKALADDPAWQKVMAKLYPSAEGDAATHEFLAALIAGKIQVKGGKWSVEGKEIRQEELAASRNMVARVKAALRQIKKYLKGLMTGKNTDFDTAVQEMVDEVTTRIEELDDIVFPKEAEATPKTHDKPDNSIVQENSSDPYSTALSEANQQATDAITEAINRGKGRFNGRSIDLLITPSNNPDVLFRVTRIGKDGTPMGHDDVTTEEQMGDILKDKDTLDVVMEHVRPDIGQARPLNAFGIKKFRKPVVFEYRLKLREVGPNTAPEGFVKADGRSVFYDRPLTKQELYDYEIEPVGAAPKNDRQTTEKAPKPASAPTTTAPPEESQTIEAAMGSGLNKTNGHGWYVLGDGSKLPANPLSRSPDAKGEVLDLNGNLINKKFINSIEDIDGKTIWRRDNAPPTTEKAPTNEQPQSDKLAGDLAEHAAESPAPEAETTTQTDTEEPFDFSRAGREVKERYDKAVAESEGFDGVEMESPTFPGMKVLITKDPSEQGKWRATRVDSKGPSGHNVFDSKEDAIADYTGMSKSIPFGRDFKVTKTRNPVKTNANETQGLQDDVKALLLANAATHESSSSFVTSFEDSGATKGEIKKLTKLGLAKKDVGRNIPTMLAHGLVDRIRKQSPEPAAGKDTAETPTKENNGQQTEEKDGQGQVSDEQLLETPPAAGEQSPVAEASVAAKEPWAMTRKDATSGWPPNQHTKDAPKNGESDNFEGGKAIKKDGVWSFETTNAMYGRPNEKAMQWISDPKFYGPLDHELIVKQALSEGKPVPAEVLADYPDLVKPATSVEATRAMKAKVAAEKKAPRKKKEPKQADSNENPAPVTKAEPETPVVTESPKKYEQPNLLETGRTPLKGMALKSKIENALESLREKQSKMQESGDYPQYAERIKEAEKEYDALNNKLEERSNQEYPEGLTKAQEKEWLAKEDSEMAPDRARLATLEARIERLTREQDESPYAGKIETLEKKLAKIQQAEIESRRTSPATSVEATRAMKAKVAAERKAPLPDKIIEALLRSGHELVPTGDSNSGFRQVLMQLLTGQKTPKAKSGVNAVEKALFEYLGVESNHYAGMRDSAKEKLRALIDGPKQAEPSEIPAPEAKAEPETPVVTESPSDETVEATPAVAKAAEKVARHPESSPLKAKEQKKYLIDAVAQALKDAPVDHPESSKNTDAAKDMAVVEALTLEADKEIGVRNSGKNEPRAEFILSRLPKELREKYGVRDRNSDGELIALNRSMDAAHSSQLPHVTIEVPGDGNFRILNTKESLAKFYKLSKKFPTVDAKSTEPTEKAIPKPTSITPVGKKLTRDDHVAIAAMATGTDENRLVLHNVFSDGERLISTDGRRLMILTSKGEGTEADPLHIDPETGKTVKNSKFLNDRMTSMPDYKQVMPATFEQTVENGDTAKLAKLIIQAKVPLTGGSSDSVILWVDDKGQIGVSSASEEGSYSGGSDPETSRILAAYNPDSLLQGILAARKMGNETVTIKTNAKMATEITGKDFQYILMPMLLIENGAFGNVMMDGKEGDLLGPESLAKRKEAKPNIDKSGWSKSSKPIKSQPNTDEATMRHAELEAKHNAGTITAAETEEAQRLVDAAAKAAGYDVEAWHGSPDFKGDAFDRRFFGRNTGLSRGGFSFTTDKSSAEAYMKGEVDQSQAMVDSANAIMGELRDRIEAGFKWEGPHDEIEPPEFRSDLVDDMDQVSDYMRELSETLPGDLASKLLATSRIRQTKGAPKLIRAFLKNPTKIDVAGKALLQVKDPAQIKSADPFTGVPLDQRFNPKSDSILKSQDLSERNRQADVNERRALEGKDPLYSTGARTREMLMESAAAKLKANPNLGRELASGFIFGERRVSDEDHFILSLDRQRIVDEITRYNDILADSNRKETPATRMAEKELERLEQEKEENDVASYQGHGSNAGRALQARQAFLLTEYSEAAVLNRMQGSMRRRLDPANPKDKAIIDKVKAEAQKRVSAVKEEQKARDEKGKAELNQAAETAHVDGLAEAAKEGMVESDPEVNGFVARVSDLYKEIKTKASKAIKSLWGIKSDSIKSQKTSIQDEVVEFATALRSEGANSIEQIRDGFVSEFGEDAVAANLDPVIDRLWEATESHIAATVSRMSGSDSTKKQATARIKKTDDPSVIIDHVLGRMKVKAGEKSNLRDLDAYTRKIGIQLIRSGIKEREALFDAIHEKVKEVFPDITRQETVESFSGYGRQKPLTTDPDVLHAIDIAAQGRELSKIDDILVKAKAHQVSGIERKAPDAETRRLIKLAKATIRANPELYENTAQGAGRSVEQAIATRLLNEIEEMDKAITNNKPMISKGGKREYSPENQKLLDQRNAKRAQYDLLFPKEPRSVQPMSLERREAVWRDGLKRRIEQLEDELAIGKVHGPEGKPIRKSGADAEQEAYLETLKAELAAGKPPKSVDSRQAQWVKSLDNSIARLTADLKEGPKQGPKEPPLPETPEIASKRELLTQLQEAMVISLENDPIRQDALRQASLERRIDAKQKEIEDIRFGKNNPSKGPKLDDSALVKAKREELKRLQAKLEKDHPIQNRPSLPPKEMTDEQRAKNFDRYLTNRIEATREQLETGNIWPERPDSKAKPTSKEIEAKRTELDQLMEKRDALRAADTAHRDEVRLKQLQKVGDQYAKRIAAMDKTGESDRTAGKGPRAMTPAEVSMRESNKRAQRQIRELQDKLAPFIIEASIKASRARLNTAAAKVDARASVLQQEIDRIKAAKESGKALSRAEIDAGRENVAELLALISRTGDAARIRAVAEGNKAEIDDMIAASKAKLAEKAKVNSDTRIIEANKKVKDSEIALRKLEMELEESTRSVPDKIGGFVKRLTRAQILSSPTVVFHLGGAGVAGVVTSHLRTVPVASARILGRILPKSGLTELLNLATHAGHASFEAERSMYVGNKKAGGELTPGGLLTKTTRKGVIEKFTKGYAAADALYGGSKFNSHGGFHTPVSVGDFTSMMMDAASSFHAMLKEGPRMAHFGKALTAEWSSAERAAKSAGDSTIDPANNELVRKVIGERALIQANKEIMMGDNLLSKALSTFLNQGLRRNKISPEMGKLAANAIEILLPVKKVPENIMLRVLSYGLGSITGPGSLIINALQGKLKGLKDGTQRLTREEAEFIVEQTRNGMLGLGVLMAAWSKAGAFGGIYTPSQPWDKKGRKLGYSDIDFGELLGLENSAVLNHQFAHDPLMMMANEVAQLRKTFDHEFETNGNVAAAYVKSASMAPFLLLQGEPVYNMISRLANPYQDAPEKVAGVAANILTNKLVEWSFAQGDKDEYGEPIKREAKTLVDKLKVGWGMRESVPVKQSGLNVEGMRSGFAPMPDGSVPKWVNVAAEWNRKVDEMRKAGTIPPGDNWKSFLPEKADNYLPGGRDFDKITLTPEIQRKRDEVGKQYMNEKLRNFTPSPDALRDINYIRRVSAEAHARGTDAAKAMLRTK